MSLLAFSVSLFLPAVHVSLFPDDDHFSGRSCLLSTQPCWPSNGLLLLFFIAGWEISRVEYRRLRRVGLTVLALSTVYVFCFTIYLLLALPREFDIRLGVGCYLWLTSQMLATLAFR
jgi:hypothetical protein